MLGLITYTKDLNLQYNVHIKDTPPDQEIALNPTPSDSDQLSCYVICKFKASLIEAGWHPNN